MYKFLQCEQGAKIDVEMVIEREKKEIGKRIQLLAGYIMSDECMILGERRCRRAE